MLARPIVTLLTDFGLSEPYVGVMKGALLQHNPDIVAVDLTHAIPRHAVEVGAFWLARSFAHFPRGTIHLVVIDPGVGTSRGALLVEAPGYSFIGPDNGVLEAALALPGAAAYELQRPQGPASTFDGRDLFAPAAALRSRGSIAGLRPASHPQRLAGLLAEGHRGRVVTVDHFGNLLTNLEGTPERCAGAVLVDGAVCPWVETYAEAARLHPGSATALVNAWGLIEVAVGNGSAATCLGASSGTRVWVQISV